VSEQAEAVPSVSKVPIEIDNNSITLQLEVPITLNRAQFDQLFRVVGLRGDSNRMLAWDCGCTTAGKVYVHAGFLFEASDSAWSLADAAREYKLRANSMPDVFTSASHHRLLEGLYHCAQQLLDESELSTHPFAKRK